MARKRKRSDKSGETGHDDEMTPVTETERQYVFSTEKAKKRRTEAFKFSVSTPNAETRKVEICITPGERGPDHHLTPIDNKKVRSSFISKVFVHTPTSEFVRRKRKIYSEVSGYEFESTPICEVRGSRQDSEVSMLTPDQRCMRSKNRVLGDFGLDHEDTLNYKAKRRITQGSELPVCTPISEILERDAHCGALTPLTAKPSKSQKKLFCGPSDMGNRFGADEEEKRGWALDRRRKGLDHGKFTEDELVSLNCGLNELMEARKWTREEASRILTHSGGRGCPHVEARGAWKEIAKYLPSSSIVRVNMKARSLLFTGKTGRWDAEETKLLQRLVQKYDNDWITISSHLGRSNGACARKWRSMRLDDCTTRKKGKWTQEEYDELCRHVRDAKATKVVTSSKKVGNRKVRDNIQWEPVAVKMCRPANQCSAVWYERLAPSIYKEACLDEEDRQWADEDDRRLLKKILKLMSLHGEISWPNVFMRNRKPATCKARFNQMTHPRNLGEKSETTLEEQLEILVRRYAPDLIVESRKELDEYRNEVVGEILQMENEETCQPRNGEDDLEPTESWREENECTMHPLEASEGSIWYESDLSESLESADELEGSMVQLMIEEEGNSAMSRNSGIQDKGSESQHQTKHMHCKSSSCKFEETVDLIRTKENFESSDKKCEVSKSSLERDEFSAADENGYVDSPTDQRRVEEDNTSRRYIYGKLDERVVNRGVRKREMRKRDKFAENFSKLNKNYCVECKDESVDSLECQNLERGIEREISLHLTNEKMYRCIKKKLYDSEDQGSRYEPLHER